MRMGMPVTMVMVVGTKAVRMIMSVVVAIAMGVAVRLAVLLGMRMHLRFYCTRL
jgi:hypothetical protein